MERISVFLIVLFLIIIFGIFVLFFLFFTFEKITDLVGVDVQIKVFNDVLHEICCYDVLHVLLREFRLDRLLGFVLLFIILQ